MRKPSLLKLFPSKSRNRDITYDAVVDEVSDGDTVIVGLLVPGYPTVAIRLTQARAPEKNQMGYVETTKFTTDLLPKGTPVKIINRDIWTFDRLDGRMMMLDGKEVALLVNRFVFDNGYEIGRIDQ